MVTDNAVSHACAQALRFLEGRRSPDGLWRDFHTLAGASSDWVSAFVAHAIACADCRRPSVLAGCKALLYRQRPNGGWSYNRSVPTDCDSTAWAMLALSTAPMWRPSTIQHGLRFLIDHQMEDTGGFATYAARDGIERFIELPETMTTGWRRAHPCVTAVTIQSLLVHGEPPESKVIHRAVAYLEKERDPTGVWRSYWWKGHAYSTYHTLRAFGMARIGHRQDVQETEAFLLAEQRADGGWSDSDSAESEVFATAFIVLALLLHPDDEPLEAAGRGVEWLISQQDTDGRWPAAPILRIPPPTAMDPEQVRLWRIDEDGTGVVVADQHGLFTTAAALWAIATFRPMLSARARPASGISAVTFH